MAALIAAQRDQHRIPHAAACRALGVSRSWFYKHKDGALPPRAARRQALAAEVRRLFARAPGHLRVAADHRRPARGGLAVSENTVAAVMREQGLAARRKKKRRSTTRPGRAAGGRRTWSSGTSRAQKINTKWYGDGTEIPTGEGKLYLASVMDMASRRVLGFALGEHHDAQLAYSALVMAVAVRGGQVPGVIMHTDRAANTPRAWSARPAPGFPSPSRWAGRVRAGQRGHRVLALHPGIRAPLGRALHHQGSGPGPGQRLDPGLQPCRRHSALGMMSPVSYEQALKAGKAA